MFIGVYELDNKKYFNIYYKNKYGYEEWYKDTFSPECKYETLDFKISGKTYQERKASLEDLAKDWQNNFAWLGWSYGECAEISAWFYDNAKRYGLIKVFEANAII